MSMARAPIPAEWERYSSAEIANAIKKSNIGTQNRRIAVLRFVDQLPLVDIGAAIHMDRTSVSHRLKTHIIPSVSRKLK